jgi:hypothetical protein
MPQLYLLSALDYSVSELGSAGAPELVGYTSPALLQAIASTANYPVQRLGNYRLLGTLSILPSGQVVRLLTAESAYFLGSWE